MLARWADVEAQLANIQYPIKPRKGNSEKQRFDIRFPRVNFPEMVLLDGVFFEPESGQDIDPKFYKIPWNGARLERVDTARGLYSVTLTQDGIEHTYKVYPVYLGSNYTTAVKMYDKVMVDNQSLTESLSVERKRLKEEIDAKKKTLVADRAAEKKKWETTEKNAVAVATTNDMLYRSFTVSRFGVMNCDQPIEGPKAVLAASFEDVQAEKLEMSNIFLIETNRNLVYTYSANSLNGFGYDPTAENVILGITVDNKVVKFSPEQFTDIPKGAKEYVFRVEVIADKMTAPGDIRKYLKLPMAGAIPTENI
jgi:hypothetical protein